jgi:hypothetical protein
VVFKEGKRERERERERDFVWGVIQSLPMEVGTPKAYRASFVRFA